MYSIPFNSIFRIPALVLAVLQLWGERRKAITTLATLCPCPAPHRRAIGRGDTWIVAFGVWHEGLVKTSYLCGSMTNSFWVHWLVPLSEPKPYVYFQFLKRVQAAKAGDVTWHQEARGFLTWFQQIQPTECLDLSKKNTSWLKISDHEKRLDLITTWGCVPGVFMGREPWCFHLPFSGYATPGKLTGENFEQFLVELNP